MSKTAGLILMLALGIISLALPAEAQPPGRIFRIGYLSSSSPSAVSHNIDAFRQGLRDLGYVEGRNIVIEYRWAEGKYDRLPNLAADLVSLKVDVIVAGGTSAGPAAQQATKTIPIVLAVSSDPVGTGLVAGLARPGGNITGLSIQQVELSAKSLELLKEAVPKVSRAAVLWNPDPASPAGAPQMRETEAAARTLGVKLQSLEVRSPDDLEGAFQAAARGRAGALLALGDPMLFIHRTRIVGLAAKNRLPAMYFAREFVGAGGLMSYGTNLADIYRRAATYVDKILKGAKPADLPVEQPMRFELVINMKTAKALGITFPPSILIRADQVIE